MKDELYQKIIQQMDLSRELEENEIYEVIDKNILEKSEKVFLTLEEKQKLRRQLFNSIRKLDVLQELLDEDDITEIMINGHKDIFIEKNGKIYKWEGEFSSKAKLDTIIQQIVANANRRVNEASPIVDARLEDGSRVNIILSPIAIDGSAITIRKFSKEVFNIKKLVEMDSMTQEIAMFLENLVIAGYNIFVSGGTGSGKTTFLNALSNFIPKDERIITIEDSAELKIQGVKNLVRLETRNANTSGEGEIKIRDLIKASLRMRPDRIVVGEVRGNEALDMLQAMNTGHDGSLSTGHANSSKDMLSRLETMVLMGMDMPLLAIRQQITSAIDIIVHLGRLRDKSRKVLEIVEIAGLENGEFCLNRLFEFKEDGEENKKIIGKYIKHNQLISVGKLRRKGIVIGI